MKVPWLRLTTIENNQLLIINCNHIGLIAEFYKEVTKMEGDGKNHLKYEIVADRANILVQGQYISVQGSPLLIQTLVTKALSEETDTGKMNKPSSPIHIVEDKKES